MPRKFRNTLLVTLVTMLLAPPQSVISQPTDGISSNSDALPPTQLNEITLGQRLHWAALQFIAPERLHTIGPVYIYYNPDIINQHITQTCLQASASPSQDTICAYGNLGQEAGESNHLLWWTLEIPTDREGCSYALNHPIPEISPVETLWMNHEDWNSAVDHWNQYNGMEGSIHSGQ